MADFNPKKLQVFVSSTFSDLIPERQAAVEAILTAGHIPAGMELFTAGDESQMEVIKQWIDESDVYLLILGGRYGSIEPKTGKSYTQLEYEYAISKNKPLFACVIHEKAIEPRVKQHGLAFTETQNPQGLKTFRDLVLSKMCKLWEDTKDIKIAVAEALAQIVRREDLSGWVRPAAQSNVPALTDELTRLSKENAALRAQLAATSAEPIISGLPYSKLKALLEQQALLGFLNILASTPVDDPPAMIPGPFATKLMAYGLIQEGPSFGYFLTSNGRAFVTTHDADRLLPKQP